MRIQLIGLGNVGQSLIKLVVSNRKRLEAMGINLSIVSISDSKGTAVNEKGLNLNQVLKHKKLKWSGFNEYIDGYGALNAIREIASEAVVELTPSTQNGEPGLSNIKTAFLLGKNVVTANKGPLVVAYRDLKKTASERNVRFLYEATVAAHVPVFCMARSCFVADKTLKIEGILNATTNFIIGEIEKGRTFEEALNEAIRAGWAETNYRDDVDGIDAARKTVILANEFFEGEARLKDVNVEGIRGVEPMVRQATKSNKKVKLICEVAREGNRLRMSVLPQQIAMNDPLATVNHGGMGIKFNYRTSKEVFVSAQFGGPAQTAYAVLNDIIKLVPNQEPC